MNSLSHLKPDTRELAKRGDEERIASLNEDRWIDYARAQKALDHLRWMLKMPPKSRMPGLLIYGDSNIGKSMVVNKFIRLESGNDLTEGWRPTPIISVQMPAAPQERRLYGQLLLAMHSSYRPSEPLASVENRTLALLEAAKPRMIIVDEIHNLLAGSAREQRASLNLLKFLSNALNCSMVVLGTRDALAAVQSDEQIASRLPAFELPRWKQNNELRKFIAGFERQLPLREPSGIADSAEMISALMQASAGVTGVMSSQLSRAAQIAIESKKERITPTILQAAAG